MFRFFRKLKYKTVAVHMITLRWTDTDTKSEASVIFQENGWGHRRLRKEGCLFPSAHKNHIFWHTVAIPWKERCLKPHLQEMFDLLPNKEIGAPFKGDNVVKLEAKRK